MLLTELTLVPLICRGTATSIGESLSVTHRVDIGSPDMPGDSYIYR